MGGFFELFNPFEIRSKDRLERLVRAFDLMGYDLKTISYEEAYYFKKYNIPLKGWVGSQDKVILKKIETKEGTLIFVVLPWDMSALDNASQKKLLTSLQNKDSLVIGISPYGYAEEEDLLDNYPHLFDILLGSGRGLIFAGQVQGRTLWVRPMSKGKAVYIISIKDLSNIKSEGPILGKNIYVKRKFITQDIEADKTITSILKGKDKE